MDDFGEWWVDDAIPALGGAVLEWTQAEMEVFILAAEALGIDDDIEEGVAYTLDAIVEGLQDDDVGERVYTAAVEGDWTACADGTILVNTEEVWTGSLWSMSADIQTEIFIFADVDADGVGDMVRRGRDPREFPTLYFQQVARQVGGPARARCEGGAETLV